MKQWLKGACGAALLLLGACDEGPEPRVKSIAVQEGGYKARIDSLAPEQRDAVFLRAVRDAGHDCQEVVGSAYNGVQFGMPSWAARCRDGRDWLIMLGKGGQAHVARREEKGQTRR